MKNGIMALLVCLLLFLLCGCANIQMGKFYPVKQERQLVVVNEQGFYRVSEPTKSSHATIQITQRTEKIGLGETVITEESFVASGSNKISSVSVVLSEIEGVVVAGVTFINSTSKPITAKINSTQLKDNSLMIIPRLDPQVVLNSAIALYNKYASTPIPAPVMESHTYSYSSGYANAYGTANTYGSTTYGHASAYGSSTTNSYSTQNETIGSSLGRGITQANANRLSSQSLWFLNLIATHSLQGDFDVPPESKIVGYIYFPMDKYDYPVTLKIEYDNEIFNFLFTDLQP
jgi:hypothetical protein